VWCPDRPITMREALAIQEDLEKDWIDFANDAEGCLKTAITAVMVTAGLGGGMRGEELNRLDLRIIRKHWSDAINHPETSHVPLGMVGRFKRTVGEKDVHPASGDKIKVGTGISSVDVQNAV
jgi:hypothetical protein